MSGHNKWSQIKNKKGATDKKRSQIFSKLLKAITVAAKNEPNSQFNPTLRSAIEKAKENQVPQENIERAIKKASESGDNLEKLIMEAYGSNGSALLVLAITDNKNRTVSEVKKILKDNDAKWADPGSVMWAFEKTGDDYRPKFPQDVSEEEKQKLENLLDVLDDYDDVQEVITNAKLE